MNNLFNQYETARNATEKEERKLIQQQGLNPQDRVFTAEEVGVAWKCILLEWVWHIGGSIIPMYMLMSCICTHIP